MADDGTGAEGTQGVQDAQTPVDADQQTPNTDTQDQASSEDVFDKDRALRTIRAQREELKQAKAATKELEQLRQERKAREEAEMTEQQRLTKRSTELEAELAAERQAAKDRELRLQVQIAAQTLNIVDPDAAVKLLDFSTVEDGDITTALKALVEDKPYLVRQDAPQPQQARTPGAATNPATRPSPAASRVWTAAEIQDRATWTANKDDIMRALREGRITD